MVDRSRVQPYQKSYTQLILVRAPLAKLGVVLAFHMDKVPPPPDDSWMGHSVGHWEGDTLVVDVTNLLEQTWFDRAGNFHSDALHLVERFTPSALTT